MGEMRFYFNERKASQAAAYLIRRQPARSVSLLKLIKLLYLADRRALTETGVTITRDKIVVMKHGLVLSNIYDKTKEDGSEPDEWFQYMTAKENNCIGLTEGGWDETEDSIDELSEYETSVLDAIDAEYGRMTPWQLRDITHALPEFTDPGDSSIPIDPAEVLRHSGMSEEDVRRLTSQAEEAYFVSKICTMAR